MKTSEKKKATIKRVYSESEERVIENSIPNNSTILSIEQILAKEKQSVKI